jgi:hypothetical protein
MRTGRFLFALLAIVFVPSIMQAQSTSQPTSQLRDRLMPTNAAALVVTAPISLDHTTKLNTPNAAAYRSAGTAYMIVGAALFAGGLIAGGDAGTVMILAGAGFGAYGLYLHFR